MDVFSWLTTLQGKELPHETQGGTVTEVMNNGTQISNTSVL